MIQQIIIKKETIKFQPEFSEICQRAKRLEDSGEYETAAKTLGKLWLGVGERPLLSGFPESVMADVLVRIGSITGWLGSTAQIDGSQEMAKDLIGEGIRLYDENTDVEKIAEAQSDLGICYWREGAFNEAENYYRDALEIAPVESNALRGKILLRLVNVAISNRKYGVAISYLEQAESIINSSEDDLLQGKLLFHQALLCKLQFEESGDKKFVDKAAQYYFEASRKYRKADHQRYEAIVENNLGYLYLSINEYERAHQHLDNATNLFSVIQDSGKLASVFDTKARVFLAEQKFEDAEIFAQRSVQLFTRGDEYFHFPNR